MRLKLIDIYILRKFLSTFAYVVILLNAIICVIDYSEKSQDFYRNKLAFSFIVKHYYINYIPYMTNLLSPIIVFLATVFVTVRLANRSEIIAMLSAGVSFRRLLVPYMIGASLLAIISIFGTTYLVPITNKSRVAFERAFIKERYFYDRTNVHFRIGPDVYAYMQNYNNFMQTGYLFTLERIVGNQLLEKLSAERIRWDSTTHKWIIENYRLHRFSGEREELRFGEKIDTTLRLSPKDFESTHLLHEELTWSELNEYIAEQRMRGNTALGIFLVQRQMAFAYPFAIIILTFMGVIVSARKSRQGSGVQIAIGFLIAFLFIIMARMFMSLGQAGSVSPFWAAWGPPLFFGLVAVVMYKTVPR
ncbi:MAG: LptF/LptG family permease [Cytophagales bacterium]|nr:LptF/LptG family permease [Bernardetiaceae bacterium]MDW8210493.1 LptF/LptG family permease [Cytophagales bacterium]